MRKSLRVSALAVMAAAMLGASATAASAAPGYGHGEEGGSHQVNFCGNTQQENEAEAEEALAAAAEQANNGHRATFCQTGIGNTITNVNPDINVNLVLPEEAGNGGGEEADSAENGSGTKAGMAGRNGA
ncbi:hypothetical protein ACFPA8_05995 [Streptomyces ovatisporus]|uniref:Secreted protein n=1 Tax=Streptomyces ovatisporus TaxID=1128682 RepID=A0ABV9A418_9ACTN